MLRVVTALSVMSIMLAGSVMAEEVGPVRPVAPSGTGTDAPRTGQQQSGAGQKQASTGQKGQQQAGAGQEAPKTTSQAATVTISKEGRAAAAAQRLERPDETAGVSLETGGGGIPRWHSQPQRK